MYNSRIIEEDGYDEEESEYVDICCSENSS